MVDTAIIPALREALRQNEIGNASPYVLSYAKLGQSGASFGIFQGDTNVDDDARKTLRKALEASGASQDVCDRIVDAVSQPCPDGSPLSRADQRLADKALSSDTGRSLVDAMDDRTLAIVTSELDTSIAAAKPRNFTIAGEAQLCIGLWVNMTGAPRTLNKRLVGGLVGNAEPPTGPLVTEADLLRYLAATKYFTMHPRNLIHFKESVAAGAKLLPAQTSKATSSPLAGAAMTSGFVARAIETAAAQWDFFGNQTYDANGHPPKSGIRREKRASFKGSVNTGWLVPVHTESMVAITICRGPPPSYPG